MPLDGAEDSVNRFYSKISGNLRHMFVSLIAFLIKYRLCTVMINKQAIYDLWPGMQWL